MKSRKLTLESLKVSSFVTMESKQAKETVKGGLIVISLDLFNCPVSQGGPSWCIPV